MVYNSNLSSPSLTFFFFYNQIKGTLFQVLNNARSTQILSVPTNVTDNLGRVVYVSPSVNTSQPIPDMFYFSITNQTLKSDKAKVSITSVVSFI